MNPPDGLPSAVTSNGWNEWSRYVLAKLKELQAELKEARKEAAEAHAKAEAAIAALNTETKTALATLNAKSGMVGFLGGMVPAVVVLIYFLVSQ